MCGSEGGRGRAGINVEIYESYIFSPCNHCNVLYVICKRSSTYLTSSSLFVVVMCFLFCFLMVCVFVLPP